MAEGYFNKIALKIALETEPLYYNGRHHWESKKQQGVVGFCSVLFLLWLDRKWFFE